MRKCMVVVSAILLFPYIFAENKSIECPTENISPCATLRTSMGFTYRVPSVNRTIQDCEQGWYYQNGTFIVDPGNAGRRSERVVNVTPENLTMSTCENLQWQLDCQDPVCHCEVNFTVSEQDKSAASGSTHPVGLIVAVVGLGLGLVFVVIFCITMWKRYSKRQGSNGRRQNGVV